MPPFDYPSLIYNMLVFLFWIQTIRSWFFNIMQNWVRNKFLLETCWQVPKKNSRSEFSKTTFYKNQPTYNISLTLKWYILAASICLRIVSISGQSQFCNFPISIHQSWKIPLEFEENRSYLETPKIIVLWLHTQLSKKGRCR